MEKAGLGDDFLKVLSPWRRQMAAGFTTWGESDALEPRSDSHDWSSGPNIQVFTLLCGIRPAAPGYRLVEIRPHLNGLPWVKATVPHPQGEISVDFKASGGGMKAEVTLPDPIAGWIEWQGRKIALHGGRQEIEF